MTELDKVYRKWYEIFYEHNKIAEKLNSKEKFLLDEIISKTVDNIIFLRDSYNYRHNLDESEIALAKAMFEKMKKVDIKELAKEIIEEKKQNAEQSSDEEISQNRKEFVDISRAAYTLGIIELKDYQSNKVNCDIIKLSEEAEEENEHGIFDSINIEIGKRVLIRYGQNRYSISKKQMKEADNYYTTSDILKDLENENIKLVDEEAVIECLGKGTIEPLVIYSIMRCKNIKPYEQAKILNEYLKDALDATEDMPISPRINVEVDLNKLANNPMEAREYIGIKAKRLSRSNLVKVKGEYKPNIISRIMSFLKLREPDRMPEVSTKEGATEQEMLAAIAYNDLLDRGEVDQIQNKDFLESLRVNVEHVPEEDSVVKDIEYDVELDQKAQKELRELHNFQTWMDIDDQGTR